MAQPQGGRAWPDKSRWDAPVPGKITVTAYGTAGRAHRGCRRSTACSWRRGAKWRKGGFRRRRVRRLHHYDLDFSFRASLRGYLLGVADDLMLVHASSGSYRRRPGRLTPALPRKFARNSPRRINPHSRSAVPSSLTAKRMARPHRRAPRARGPATILKRAIARLDTEPERRPADALVA